MSSALSGPSQITHTAATEAPIMAALRDTAEWMPVALATLSPAPSARSGTSADLAVLPGVSSRPLRKTRVSSTGNGRPVVAASTGMSRMVAPLARSATMAAVRKPIRSTRTPPRAPPTITGTVANTPAIPVASTEPVSCSTYKGMTMTVMTLPSRESPCPPNRAISARRPRRGAGPTASLVGPGPPVESGPPGLDELDQHVVATISLVELVDVVLSPST
nr:hypothetical protein BJQ95_01831 [Cryobacterium sp. SO1]